MAINLSTKLARVTEKILDKFGQSCTITWPNRALNNRESEEVVTTSCMIEAKQVPVATGGLVLKVEAILPLTDRDLVGASLAVSGSKYKIVSVVNLSDAVQRVVLS